ncbi:organic cation transporter protein-like isoform X3 [Argopecten irradians]|uniref:organic cation transporter protein-like isoform X3 n=1 Tax=Argopecten irradians TaxID=31199 RepID=UPI0037116EEB
MPFLLCRRWSIFDNMPDFFKSDEHHRRIMSVHFDDTLRDTGEFGPYQKRIYFLLCLLIIFIGISDVINALLLYTPSHSCSSLNVSKDNNNYLTNGTGSLNKKESGCMIEMKDLNTSVSNESMSVSCTSWMYDKSVFLETIVTENDLVCDSNLVPVYIQMVIYGGSFCGSLLQGIVADSIGRKKTICMSLIFLLGSGLSTAWSVNYYMFTVLRFLQGMFSRGVYIPAFVLGIELVGPTKRQYAGFLLNFFYSGGSVLLAGIGYGFRHWKYIQIVSTAPLLLSLIYWCFVVYHCYFGFALNTENLSGHFYLNFLINGLVEFPADAIALVFSNRIGRKKLYITSMFIGGVLLLGSAGMMLFSVEGLRNTTVAMAMLGKSGVTVGYCVIYLWAAEIFPTVFRNSGMGVSLACGNIGYIVAPFISKLATNSDDTKSGASPLFVFGSFSILASLLTLLLPETNKENLPESVGQARQASNHFKMKIKIQDTS